MQERLQAGHTDADTRRDAATAKNNLGLQLKTMGQYNEAMMFYEDALKARTELLGPTHPDTIVTQYNMVELYR